MRGRGDHTLAELVDAGAVQRCHARVAVRFAVAPAHGRVFARAHGRSRPAARRNVTLAAMRTRFVGTILLRRARGARPAAAELSIGRRNARRPRADPLACVVARASVAAIVRRFRLAGLACRRTFARPGLEQARTRHVGGARVAVRLAVASAHRRELQRAPLRSRLARARGIGCAAILPDLVGAIFILLAGVASTSPAVRLSRGRAADERAAPRAARRVARAFVAAVAGRFGLTRHAGGGARFLGTSPHPPHARTGIALVVGGDGAGVAAARRARYHTTIRRIAIVRQGSPQPRAAKTTQTHAQDFIPVNISSLPQLHFSIRRASHGPRKFGRNARRGWHRWHTGMTSASRG